MQTFRSIINPKYEFSSASCIVSYVHEIDATSNRTFLVLEELKTWPNCEFGAIHFHQFDFLAVGFNAINTDQKLCEVLGVSLDSVMPEAVAAIKNHEGLVVKVTTDEGYHPRKPGNEVQSSTSVSFRIHSKEAITLMSSIEADQEKVSKSIHQIMRCSNAGEIDEFFDNPDHYMRYPQNGDGIDCAQWCQEKLAVIGREVLDARPRAGCCSIQ